MTDTEKKTVAIATIAIIAIVALNLCVLASSLSN